MRVWSADGSGQPLVLRGHNEVVYQAAWSPDGQRIVSASYDKTVRVWNADGAGQPLVLRGHDRFVFGAAFSPDGRRIVSASEDKTVRVWNADGTGQPLVLRGHETSVTVHGDRAFSPDGARFVGTSEDATVRVWNADGTGEPLVLRASNAPVDTASWSADGRRIVGASGDKTVIVWERPRTIRGLRRSEALDGHELLHAPRCPRAPAQFFGGAGPRRPRALPAGCNLPTWGNRDGPVTIVEFADFSVRSEHEPPSVRHCAAHATCPSRPLGHLLHNPPRMRQVGGDVHVHDRRPIQQRG